MNFVEAIRVIKNIIPQCSANEYDGILVKRLEASNTLDEGRTTNIYVENKGLEWERMKSRRYCKKMEVLFGVNDIEELKGKIEKCVYNSEISYLRGWDAAPAILNYIKVEDIGTLN